MPSEELDRTTVVNLYRAEQSIKAIAEQLGVSPDKVSKSLDDWGEPKRDARELGRVHATPSYARGRSMERRPWAEAFTASGRNKHCPACQDLIIQRQRARARGDSDAVKQTEELFAEHAGVAHPHLLRIYG